MLYDYNRYKANFGRKFKNALEKRYPVTSESRKEKGFRYRYTDFCNDYSEMIGTDKSVKSRCDSWKKPDCSAPDIESLLEVCSLLDCDPEYFLTDQEYLRKDINNASKITGLSYEAIELLHRMSDITNRCYHINKENIDMLNLLLSSYLNELTEEEIKQNQKGTVYQTIFRYMWGYINSSDFVTYIDGEQETDIYIENKKDDYSEPIPVHLVVPDLMEKRIIDELDKFKKK